ncbi:MAG: hypothetical protein OEM52_05845 [bacterium]|nr:hypothetical protein [bacterium]
MKYFAFLLVASMIVIGCSDQGDSPQQPGNSLQVTGFSVIPHYGTDSVWVELTWSATPSAESYMIHRGYGHEIPNEMLARVTALSYTDLQLDPAAMYGYQIIAERGQDVGESEVKYMAPRDTLHYSSVEAVLNNSCVACHSGGSPLGGWSVSGLSAAVTNQSLNSYRGSSNNLVVKPFEPLTSNLYLRVIHTNQSLRMPQGSPQLPNSEVNLIRNWISQGALE